jgi:hypothetical protein
MSGSDDAGGYAALIFFRASARKTSAPDNTPIIIYDVKAKL